MRALTLLCGLSFMACARTVPIASSDLPSTGSRDSTLIEAGRRERAAPSDDGPALCPADSDSTASCGWRLYSYDLKSGVWGSTYLRKVWTGPNAPPSKDITAAVQLSDFDHLLVFDTAGTFYVRITDVWQKPVPAATRFPSLPTPVAALYHVPYAWSAYWNAKAPFREELTFTANPNYFIYSYREDGTVTLDQTGVSKDNAAPGAPQYSGKALWDFEVMDLNKIETPEGYLLYTEYSDGYVYRFDAAFAWNRWPTKQSPFWSSKTGAPATSPAAAYFDYRTKIAYFIGP